MIAFHTAFVVIMLIHAVRLHQDGCTWTMNRWHKSISVAAIVTNVLAIAAIILTEMVK